MLHSHFPHIILCIANPPPATARINRASFSSQPSGARPVMLVVILLFVATVYAYFFWPVDMMKAPDDAGMLISREAFESMPRLYFYLLRNIGGGFAGFVFSGFSGSLICIVCSLWRFVLNYFVYGGLLRGFVLPVIRSFFGFTRAIASILYGAVCSLLSSGGGAVYFVYDGLFRGFLIPIVCSYLKLGRDVAGIMYGGLIHGLLIPVVSSLLSFGAAVAGFVYNGLFCGFLIPVVYSLLSFGGGVASFMYGLLFRDWFIPFVIGLLVAPVMRFLFADDW